MMHCNQRYFILHSLTFSFNADSGTQNLNQYLAREQILLVITLGLLNFLPAKKEKKLSNFAETLFNSPGSGVVACLCGNTTGGGQKPPPATGCTTLTGLDGWADGTNSGDAA